MTFLASNILVPPLMRPRFQFALSVLPVAMMLVACVPSYYFALWLEKLPGIPAATRLLDHPQGRWWLAALLGSLALEVVAGYALGWLLNALLARWLWRWPAEKVRAVFVRSELPARWLTPAAAALAGDRVALVAVARWERQRKTGALPFILRRGVLGWGLPMFIFMYPVHTLLRGEAFVPLVALVNVLLWFGCGALFGALHWALAQRNYRALQASLGLGVAPAA